MRYVSVLLLAVALAGYASACTYYCQEPSTGNYVCCDDGNPFLIPDELPVPDNTEVEEEEQPLEEVAPSDGTQQSSGCYYYCVYAGNFYCCGDTSVPIPESHDPHDGDCPGEDEQVCKSSGIFLVTKKGKVAKTSGSMILAHGSGKEQATCASDGYCAQDEKCCPSKCAGKHICLKSLDGPNKVNGADGE